MPAVALTDHGNLFGAVDFYKACQAADVKPILGCEFYVAPSSRLEKKKERNERSAYHLTLLAKNFQGYRNLCKLSSLGYLEGFYYHPRIDHPLLEKYHEGLICLSGCMSGRLAQEVLHGTEDQVEQLIEWYLAVFKDDFYLELQRHPMTEEDLQRDGITQETWVYQKYEAYIKQQDVLNTKLLALSKEKGIALIATNDSHYMERSDWKAHEILLNIQSGEPCEMWEKDSHGNPKFRCPNPRRRIYPSHEFYFKSPQQIVQLFQDIPEAVSNTIALAGKCRVELDFKTKHYPVYVPPALQAKSYTNEERMNAVESYLRKLCEDAIPTRYTPEALKEIKKVYPNQEPMEVVRERIEREMRVIVPQGMCDYLLIVWDFIHWAKKQAIPVGPGRGSGVGSIILYLIGITDIEPLRFHLFFERFINPERLSYPDIDVDICMERRSEVIQYALEKYGKESVSQIITFGTMKAKMVIRDVGRVLSVPLSKVNAIAKLVPDELGTTLETALLKDPDLKKMYQNDEETKRVFDLGKRLEGSIRNTGIHAAGIIISGEPLFNSIPVCVSKESEMPVAQYSMKPAEQVGMLKMDLLGLKTLTAIQECVNAVKVNTQQTIDWGNLPLNDTLTFDILNQGKTLGIFQLESGGMQDLARNLKLDRFEEIIAVGALYRPGPMDMIPSFINRKHGKEAIEYDHPWMKEILAETYGIMVYQEQVMQIASKLANYSLGEGDVLRRAMGKKEMKQMAQQREKFRQGAIENHISEQTAMQIFDKMEKFAAYGFNKSHAAAYGYISYVTAYLKAHFPKEWMAALMTCDRHDLTKVAKFIRECQAMSIPILPPDVNEAGASFVARSQGIRFAMSGIKGVGTGVVEGIVAEREENGPYKNLYDFIERIGPAKTGKKVVENLVDAGSFDFTGWSRDALKLSIEPMFRSAAKERKEADAGVISLFTLIGESTQNQFSKPPDVKSQTPLPEVLLKEKELLGFFLTGHPMDAYKNVLRRLSCIPLRKVETMPSDTVFRSGVIIESVSVRFSSKSQRKFAIVTVSDGMENYELPIWPDLYEAKHHLLRENQLLYAVLHVDRKGGGVRLGCKWLDDLTKATELMIQDCDAAYDKAKRAIARSLHIKQNRKKEVSAVEKKIKTFKFSVDAEKTRLSHILSMKSLFQKFRGDSPVQIDFIVENSSIAVLHIDRPWGVLPSNQLKEAIKSLPSVLSIIDTEY